MKILKFFFSIALFLNATVLHCNLSYLSSDHYGLYSFSEDEINEIIKNSLTIDSIQPNKLGSCRMYGHEQGKQLYKENFLGSGEFSFSIGQGSSTNPNSDNLSLGASQIPSAVDNSTLPSFPAIGNQLNLASCVAWATTYYQATHELGLLNGYNNKTSTTKVQSPTWTYNLLNKGANTGLNPFDAYSLLNLCGSIEIQNLPYSSNYKAWDLNTQDWINATKNRMLQATTISGLNLGNGQDLTNIKQALANGHVLTFGTYINSWVVTKIKKDPKNINNAHINDYAVRYMKGRSGGHCMTIVGFDDTLWVDVNNSGNVDSGERGAFKVANSWGASWGNQGFIWISYDAFRSISGVKNMNKLARVPLAEPINSLALLAVPKMANYSPSLLGSITISQSRRNQIKVSVGASAVNSNQPSISVVIPALNYSGGSFDFSGTTNNTSPATFAFDLTDFATNQPSYNRYYLTCQDSAAGFPTTISNYKLIDAQHNTNITSTYPSTSVDAGKVSQYIDYNFLTSFASNQPSSIYLQSDAIYQQPTTVKISSHNNNQLVKGLVHLNVSVSSGHDIKYVDLYHGEVFLERDDDAPYLFFIDTKKFKNGKHDFHVVVTDSLETKVSDSVTLQIRNAAKSKKQKLHGFYEIETDENFFNILIDD